MKNKWRISALIAFEFISVFLFGIIIPSLLITKYLWVVQCVLLILFMGLFLMLQYSRLLVFLKEIMARYDIQTNRRLTLYQALKYLSVAFEDGQITMKRYKNINKTLGLAIEMNNALLKTMEIKELYKLILDAAIESIERCDKGSIMLLNKEDELEFVALHGFDEDFYNIRIPLVDSFLYKETHGSLNKVAIVNSVVEFNRQYMSDEEFEAFYKKFPMDYQTTMTAPIRFDDTFLGVINLDSNEFEGFTEEDVAIMDLFASQLEVMIKNHHLISNNQHLSRYDTLTGAYNRSYFEVVIKGIIQNKGQQFSFIVIDINDLKKVNDQYGHFAGDELLKAFAKAVRTSIRLTDHFARVGGDEFILVLNDFSKMETTKIFIRIMQHLGQIEREHELPYAITFSYGITAFPEEADTYDKLYIKSDQRMYEMKRRFKES